MYCKHFLYNVFKQAKQVHSVLKTGFCSSTSGRVYYKTILVFYLNNSNARSRTIKTNLCREALGENCRTT